MTSIASPLVGPEEISARIVELRGQRVLLDADLARIYGEPTKPLNEQVKRNARRFPADFMFQLTRAEAQNLRALNLQTANLEYETPNRSHFATGSRKHRDLRILPYAFTEHGAIQAANVLNSDAAIDMGVYVVRAFLRLRQWLGTQKAFADKLDELENRVGAHDEQLAAVIEALRQLTSPAGPDHDRKIGFHAGNR
jgi:hypothetical protein